MPKFKRRSRKKSAQINTMETLKKFDEICTSDPRHDSFCKINMQTGAFGKFCLEDFYKRAGAAQLHDGVPEIIRSHFETARNLIIYSWFYYPFNITAELCAYTSVEFALRIKNGPDPQKPPFKWLLQKAVQEKWITDDGFRHIKARKERVREYNQHMPPELQLTQSSLVDEYCQTLTEVFPFLRNGLAHGCSMLHEHGASTVQSCADLINQLFPRPT
jgi:hypothetical protein